MKKEKNYGLTRNEKIMILFFMFMGLFELSRAFYWIKSYNVAIDDSELYYKLAEILPLYIWAIPFLFSGILLIVAGFYLVKQNSKKFELLLFSGSSLASLGHAFLTMASIHNGISILTPLQNFTLMMLFLFICIVGGESLWKKTAKK